MVNLYNLVLEGDRLCMDYYKQKAPVASEHIERDLSNAELLNRLKLLSKEGKASYLVDFLGYGVTYDGEGLRQLSFDSVGNLLSVLPTDDAVFIIHHYANNHSMGWSLQGIYVDDNLKKIFLIPSYIKTLPVYTGLSLL